MASLFQIILPNGEKTFIKYDPQVILIVELKRCCTNRNLDFEEWCFVDSNNKEILITPELKLADLNEQLIYFINPNDKPSKKCMFIKILLSLSLSLSLSSLSLSLSLSLSFLSLSLFLSYFLSLSPPLSL
jgi:hypothetical protein